MSGSVNYICNDFEIVHLGSKSLSTYLQEGQECEGLSVWSCIHTLWFPSREISSHALLPCALCWEVSPGHPRTLAPTPALLPYIQLKGNISPPLKSANSDLFVSTTDSVQSLSSTWVPLNLASDPEQPTGSSAAWYSHINPTKNKLLRRQWGSCSVGFMKWRTQS